MGNSTSSTTGNTAGTGKGSPTASAKTDDATKRHSSELDSILARAESRLSKIAVTGRYHQPPKKIEDDYVLDSKVLGSGYNGSVYLATKGGHKYAVKDFKLRGITKKKKEELEGECEIFLAMDHPHVARLTDVYESAEKLSLVMECMEGGELFDRVLSKKRFAEQDAAFAAYQMLLAINYIHTQGIVHRDIKLENWLYESEASDHLKLIDFGFSKIWDPDTKMKMSCGTLAYVAPEVLAKNYTSQCDIWSLGIVVFILLVGYMPFSGSDEKQMRNIAKGEYSWKPDKWKLVSAEGADFVKKLLIVDPAMRFTASGALGHPWLDKRSESTPANVDKEIVSSLVEFAQESKFRRACMQAMAWSLSNEERAAVREGFMALDKTKGGTITLAEFKQVMQEQFHIEDDKVKEAFEAIDVGHNGQIMYSEFLAAMVSSRIAMHDELLQQTFKRFDTDSSGYISSDNLREVLGGTLTDQELHSMMSEIDANHDGKISYEEFITYCRSPKAHDNHKEASHFIIDNTLKKHDSVPKKLTSRAASFRQ